MRDRFTRHDDLMILEVRRDRQDRALQTALEPTIAIVNSDFAIGIEKIIALAPLEVAMLYHGETRMIEVKRQFVLRELAEMRPPGAPIDQA